MKKFPFLVNTHFKGVKRHFYQMGMEIIRNRMVEVNSDLTDLAQPIGTETAKCRYERDIECLFAMAVSTFEVDDHSPEGVVNELISLYDATIYPNPFLYRRGDISTHGNDMVAFVSTAMVASCQANTISQLFSAASTDASVKPSR